MRTPATLLLSSFLIMVLVSCGGGGSNTPVGTVSVSPSSATVGLGGTQQFTEVLSTGAAVTATWSVNGVQGGNSTVGTIDGNGLYHAPTTFPSPSAFMVTASASAGTATASLTVAFPNDNHTAQGVPVKLGTSGGNANDFVDSGSNRTCCSGTLGSLVTRAGTLFILSNNHVLNRSDAGGATGQAVQQPGLVDNQCDVNGAPSATSVGIQTEAPALKPSPCSPAPCTGAAPSNVDAAIAAINLVNVDNTGSILDLGAAGSTSIAAAPPSATLAVAAVGQAVAKSGRSTGLTCSNVGSVTTSVSVQYDAACGGAVAFTANFTNQVIINGGTFSASGDSGSLVVTSDTARPVGLLFAGNTTSTTANPIQSVLAAMPGGPVTMVGGGDHSVSCDPTTSSSASTTVGPSATKLSTQETQRVTAVKEKNANHLLENEAVSDVSVGASADSPQEGALVITLREATQVPPVVDGVRTRVVYADMPVPRAQVDAISGARLLNQAHAQSLMQQPGIQGVGIGISDDNPAEPAMVIYTIAGVSRADIPAVMDGMRTKIIEGDRFRAFGWGKDTKPACSSRKPASPVMKKTRLRLP